MGVFSLNENQTMTELDNCEPIPCEANTLMEGAYNIIIESEENYNKMMEWVGISELAHFEQTGEEMVYEGANLSKYVETVKNFFMTIWKKVQGLFTKFLSLVEGWIRTDKSFINRYAPKLRELKTTSDLKDFKGYNFTLDAVTVDHSSDFDSVATGKGVLLSGLSNAGDDAIKKSNEAYSNVDNFGDLFRGKVFSKESLSSKEFSSELFKALRGTKSEKEDIKSVNIEDIIKTLTDAKDIKEKAKKSAEDIKTSINKIITALNKAKGSVEKGEGKEDTASNRIKAMSNAVNVYKEEVKVMQDINGAIINTLKAKSRQCKAMCVKLLGNVPDKKKDENIKESFYEGGFLGELTFK